MNQDATAPTRQLEDAFQAFNRMSLQLASSYRDLEDRVARLSEELAAARSERLRQLAEKERLANRLERLLEALPGGVVVLDGAGTVREANPAAFDLLGEPLLDVSWETVTARVFDPEGCGTQELRLLDGRYLSMSSRSLGAEPGRILLLQDVSETRSLQETVNRHQRLSAMGEMVASLAHQVRTPLASAVLYMSHLRAPRLQDKERTRFADKVLARLRHLERMVNDMLTFARGGAMGVEDIEVGALCGELAQTVEPQLQGVQGALEIVDRTAGVGVRGNREALAGALLNLVTNALQACGEGARLRLTAARCGEGLVQLTLDDNGPGIPDSIKDRLFEPFVTTRSDGTGLGLAVVRSVVQSHNGQVSVAASNGGGARFTVTLPVAGSSEGLPSGVFAAASRQAPGKAPGPLISNTQTNRKIEVKR